MSAYQVSPEHLAYLAAAFDSVHRPGHHIRGRDLSLYTSYDSAGTRIEPSDDAGKRALFNALALENALSVGYRYGECLAPVPEPAHRFRWPSVPCRTPADVAAIVKAIRCYEYQACEHPGWKDSAPYLWLRRLTNALFFCMPGFADAYEDATWGCPLPTPPVNPAAAHLAAANRR